MSVVHVGNNIIALITGGALASVQVPVTPPYPVEDTEILTLSPAAIMAAYLIETLDIAVSYTSGEDWPLYINHLPDGDNVRANSEAIYDTSGVLDGRLMEGAVMEHHGIMIRLRALDYQDGWQKLRWLVAGMQQITRVDVVINAITFRLKNASRTSSMTYMGLDQKRRFMFTVNFLVTITEL